MKFELPALPYELNALEPFISKETLKVHYGKHHAKYVDTLNQLIENTPYDRLSLEEIILESAGKEEDKKIFNNAGQTWNHTFYWSCMTPEQKHKPSSELIQALEQSYGSFAQFSETFKKKAIEVFGSGWLWLVKNEDGTLQLVGTQNAECPLTENQIPLLTVDVWEHAYYLDYKNERNTYIDNFMKVINWEFVEMNFSKRTFDFASKSNHAKGANQPAQH